MGTQDTSSGSSTEPDSEPVPKLPRGRGLRFSLPDLLRVGMLAAALVGIVVMTRPCANAVSGFVMGMDGSAAGSGSATNAMPKPGTVDVPQPETHPEQFERLGADMTEAELKAAIERAKARNAASAVPAGAGTAGSGAGAAGSGAAGSGTAGAGTAGSAAPLPAN